jgi:hypothetical protein
MREITPVGDFDGDGRADVTAVDQATGNLYLFPGRGTSFAPRRLIGRGGWNGMSELTGAGDFTRDSRPDLIARSTTTGELFVYPGTRTGFAPRMRIGTGWKPMRDLAGVGDFDRDGFTDLAAVRSSTGELHLYTGRATDSAPMRSSAPDGPATDRSPDEAASAAFARPSAAESVHRPMLDRAGAPRCQSSR